MRRVRQADTKPEMIVRRLVHSLGYRYGLHSSSLPGSPDLVFRSRSKVILVHGCFWHQHKNCRQYRMPKSRLDFWLPKLDGNKRRDLAKQRELRDLGWKILVIWERQVGIRTCSPKPADNDFQRGGTRCLHDMAMSGTESKRVFGSKTRVPWSSMTRPR